MKQFEKIILDDIKNGFSGAVLAIYKGTERLYLNAFGYKRRYSEKFEELEVANRELMDVETLFDIASNSKIYGTTFALMKLAYEKKIDIERPISEYIKGFSMQGETPNIKELLSHCSGFAPEIHFFDASIPEHLYSQERSRTLSILRTQLSADYLKGTEHVYSDINFMLLGLLVEEVTGMTQDRYLEANFFKPLGLKFTGYLPLKRGISPSKIAVTQADGNSCNNTQSFPNMRNYSLRGEVHDEKAFYSMDGVAGHAGIFTTILELEELVNILYYKGSYKGITFFNSETLTKFSHYNLGVDPSFGLGFRRGEGSGMRKFYGQNSSERSFGHTGFTGTLTLIDPENDIRIIYLSNRIHGPITGRLEFMGRTMRSGLYGEIVDAIYDEYIMEK